MSHVPGTTFLPMVQLGENPGDCWLWIGKVSKTTGYGHKQFAGKTVLAHRWLYQQLFGPIPIGRVINHLCGNRRCVNPHHLEVTTHTGNCRHGKGAKLTEAQVRGIRNELASARRGDRKRIADRYGVSAQLISDIKYGRAWGMQ